MREENKTSMLLKKGEDWRENACLNFLPDHSDGYVWGYKEAADYLASHASENNKQDLFIYPMMFLYRHYLELRFKVIIIRGKELIGESGSFPHTHKLSELWSQSKAILQKIWNQEIAADFVLVEKIVNDFEQMDSRAEAFRYPMSRAGDKYLADVKHINIEIVARGIGEVAGLLESAYAGILECLETKREYKYYKP